MAIVKKYHIVKITQKNTHTGDTWPVYACGWGKFSKDISEAKCYSNIASIKKLMKEYADHSPELLYATLTVENANDMLEREFELI